MCGAASPLLVTGSAMVGLRAIGFGRVTGMSSTTYGPLFARYALHEMGARDDEAAARVMRALPSTSRLGLRMVMEPIRLAARVSGHTPKFARFPFDGPATLRAQLHLRTAFIDEALADCIDEVAQVVILGAGFDTRAYGPLGERAVFFEVDTEATQPFKTAALDRAGVNRERVRFVTVRFEEEDWPDRLEASGFDRGKPTFFLWEGVTYYLEPDTVERTLAILRELAAPGSHLALDYFTDAIREDRTATAQSLSRSLRAVGEPLRSGLPDASRRTASAYFAPHGFALERHAHTGEYGGLALLSSE